MHITGLQELRDPEWYFLGPGRLTEAGAVGDVPHKFEHIDLVELIHKVTPRTANSYLVLPPCPELQGKIVGNIILRGLIVTTLKITVLTKICIRPMEDFNATSTCRKCRDYKRHRCRISGEFFQV